MPEITLHLTPSWAGSGLNSPAEVTVGSPYLRHTPVDRFKTTAYALSDLAGYAGKVQGAKRFAEVQAAFEISVQAADVRPGGLVRVFFWVMRRFNKVMAAQVIRASLCWARRS